MTATNTIPCFAPAEKEDVVYGEPMAQPIPPGVIITLITEDDDIPSSFYEGLEDCEAGSVVDMDQALNDAPAP